MLLLQRGGCEDQGVPCKPFEEACQGLKPRDVMLNVLQSYLMHPSPQFGNKNEAISTVRVGVDRSIYNIEAFS